MQKCTLPLSLLIGAALTIPSLAMAAPADTNDITPVDITTTTANNTLETEVESTEGELPSTQPSAFEISETKTISLARISNKKEELATKVEAVQDSQQNMQDSQHNMQDPQDSMQPQPLIR